MLPGLSIGGVHVALDEVRIAREPELDGSGVRAGDVGVVGVDEDALGLRARARPARGRGRIGGAFEGVGLLGRAEQGLFHVRVLAAARKRDLRLEVNMQG